MPRATHKVVCKRLQLKTKGEKMADSNFDELVAAAVKKALCADGETTTEQPVVTETSSKSIEGKASSGADSSFDELVAAAVKKALCADGEATTEQPVVTETSSKSIEGKASSGHLA
jgi:translation elongation factor EF-Tu-like GTPase